MPRIDSEAPNYLASFNAPYFPPSGRFHHYLKVRQGYELFSAEFQREEAVGISCSAYSEVDAQFSLESTVRRRRTSVGVNSRQPIYIRGNV